MATASPLTDPTGPSIFGPLVDKTEPEKKTPAPTSDAASPDVVKRVRAATGESRPAESAPSSGDLKFPTMQPLPPPPKREDTPPIEAWGSLAMLAAALGGARSRTHATTALNAAGAALQGLHQRDQEKFKNEMERWKIATDNAQKLQSYEIETYKAIMAQKARTFEDFIKLSRNEQMEQATQIHAQSLALQNQRVADQMEHQHWEEFYKDQQAREKTSENQQKERDKIENVHTMETTWAAAANAGDQEAKNDPNAWKWKRFPEAAEKGGIPKSEPPKADSDGGDGSWFGFGGSKSTPSPTPSTTGQSPGNGVTMLDGKPSVMHDGKRLVYKGTGDYDDIRNWEAAPVH